MINARQLGLPLVLPWPLLFLVFCVAPPPRAAVPPRLGNASVRQSANEEARTMREERRGILDMMPEGKLNVAGAEASLEALAQDHGPQLPSIRLQPNPRLRRRSVCPLSLRCDRGCVTRTHT
jgi:hypothetical protein